MARKYKSKRITLHHKYKVEKKVLSHHRKLRRIARRMGVKRSNREIAPELTIPNSWPHKEQMLKEMIAERDAIQSKRDEYYSAKKERVKELKAKKKAGIETKPDIEEDSDEEIKDKKKPKKSLNLKEGKPSLSRRKATVSVEADLVEQRREAVKAMQATLEEEFTHGRGLVRPVPGLRGAVTPSPSAGFSFPLRPQTAQKTSDDASSSPTSRSDRTLSSADVRDMEAGVGVGAVGVWRRPPGINGGTGGKKNRAVGAKHRARGGSKNREVRESIAQRKQAQDIKKGIIPKIVLPVKAAIGGFSRRTSAREMARDEIRVKDARRKEKEKSFPSSIPRGLGAGRNRLPPPLSSSTSSSSFAGKPSNRGGNGGAGGGRGGRFGGRGAAVAQRGSGGSSVRRGDNSNTSHGGSARGGDNSRGRSSGRGGSSSRGRGRR